jgi:GTP-binding protein
VPVSAKDGDGVEELLKTALRMHTQLNRHTETGPLNQALEHWLEENPPPIGPHTRFKLKYAVQTSDNPVRFVFFASRPQAVGESYVSYLRNRLRRDLGYSMIPLGVEIRSSGGNRRETSSRRKPAERG